MWSSRLRPFLSASALLVAIVGLTACTVEPLNVTRSDSAVSAGTESPSVSALLASTEVAEVSDRVAQQVRNELLFAMNGGKLRPNGRYKVNLSVASYTRTLSIETSAKAPTSAQVEVRAGYTLVNKSDNKVITSGSRSATAAYDRTPQNFSNQRAERNAQDSAAKSAARQIRLALGQALAGQ